MFNDSDYLRVVDDAWTEALSLARAKEGWKLHSEDKNSGDVLETTTNAKGKKIWRVTARIEMPSSILVEALRDTDSMATWNSSLKEAKVLKKINDKVTISYQVTASGGPVSSRDFVYVSKAEYSGDEFIMGGCSVESDSAPVNSNIVRAVNGPGCHIVSPDKTCAKAACHVTWLMDCDYKGWIPQSVMNAAMPFALNMFVDSVRKLATMRKEEGRF